MGSMCERWILLVVATLFFTGSAVNSAHSKDEGDDLTQLYELLSKRPNVIPDNVENPDGPLDVFISLYILNMDVDTRNQELKLQMYFRQEWTDSTYGATKVNALNVPDSTGIWSPDTFFVNEKSGHLHTLTKENSFFKVRKGGEMIVSQRMSVNLVCDMDLRRYPFDVQICAIPAESYAYDASEILLHWKPNTTFGVYEPPGFSIEYSTYEEVLSFNDNEFSRVELNVHIQRLPYDQMLRIYLPLCLVVVWSWTSFWLDPSSTSARLVLTVTAVGTALLVQVLTKDFFYALGYLTALDVWVGFSTALIYAALLQNAYVAAMSGKIDNLKKISKVDYISKIGFPCVFALFNFIYFVHLLV